MKNQYEHLIVRNIQWVDHLPDHEGSFDGKGFPILMNQGLVPEAKAWVCPTLGVPSEAAAAAVNSGLASKANPHIHDCDEMYLVFGEPDVVRIKVTLRDDEYEVSSPGAVYIPAGLPHSIIGSKATAGVFGGSCQVALSANYTTKPVPEHPLQLADTSHLIIRDIQWIDHLPDHEGSVSGKGFPILMNGDLVPEANAWVCPSFVVGEEWMNSEIQAGNAPKATLHTHEQDEMYLILGADGACDIDVELGNEKYTVTSPGAVYIPAGLPHSIAVSRITAGQYCGSCQIVLGSEYRTKSAL